MAKLKMETLADYASALEPSVHVEEAPASWEALRELSTSLSCEVENIATAVTAEASATTWVYRLSPETLPAGTHGLFRLSVLLRGPESTGMRKYVHSVVLALRQKEGPPLALDVAVPPEATDDPRVLEFTRFPAERPLFFGSSPQDLEVHVHLREVPPESCGRSMVKIVADAMYAPLAFARGSRSRLGLIGEDVQSSSADAVLVCDGALSLVSATLHPHADARPASLPSVENDSMGSALTVQLSGISLSHKKRAYASDPWSEQSAGEYSAKPSASVQVPYWQSQMEACAEILPTLYSS